LFCLLFLTPDEAQLFILIYVNHLGGNQLAIKVIFKYD